MAAYEKHTQPCTASTPLSAFLMGGNFSASTGGGYSDLVNFKKGQFSHKKTRNVDEMSSCASFLHLNELFESSSSHADHLEASEKYEFKAKNKVISTRLKSQGLRRKHIKQCGNIIPQVGKYAEQGRNIISQVGIYTEQRRNSSAQVGKYTKHCGNSFAQLGKYTKHCGNSFAQVGKYTKQRRNSSAQVGKYVKQHGNSFAQLGKYTKHCGNWSQRDALLTEFCLARMARIFASQKPSKLAFPQVGICIKQHGNIIRHLDRLGDQTVIEPVEITAACLRQQIT